MFSIFYQSLSNASRTAHPLTAANRLVFLVGLCLGVARLYGQPSATPDPRFWAPDGPVNAILITNNTMYLGGDFLYVGPRTGPAAVFDQANGNLLAAPARINGTIRAVVPDGNGGWFIGGSFANIGVTPITNVAHLNADLSLDPRWNALISGTAVNALQLDGNRLYIGGQYTRIGGQVRGNLAAVNVSNGSLVTTWDPQVGGSVNALRVAGSLIYVGGNFFNVGNSNNTYLAAISTATSLATGWRPDSGMQAQVFALEVSGNTVYIGGGDFITVGTRSRHYLASIDATTGIAVNTWNPNPNGVVRAIFVVGSTVYVGGDFTTISVANRRGFAAINAGNGAAQTLDLQLQSVSPASLVRSLLLQGNSLFVGGSFTNALGAQHPLLIGVDITSSSPVPVPLGSEFNGTAGSTFGCTALAGANGNIFVGGEFQSIGGVARQRAAALSLTTGAVLPWAPAFNATVSSFAYGANGIYVGGSFSNLNTTNIVQGLAAVNPVSGDPITTFNFQGSGQFGAAVSVGALAIRSNSLYVGGSFTAVGALQRRFLAAVDTTSGNAFTNFDAKLGGGSAGITALAISGTNLFAGGDFTTVNAVSFARLAGVTVTTGAPLSWPTPPNPNQPVTAISVTPDNLYVGGQFTTIGGVTLRSFATFSLADRSLLPVDASLSAFDLVNAIGATPTTIYVAGSFTSIGGEFRLNLANLGFNASAYEWDPAPDQPPTVITLTDQYAVVGGPFRSLGRSPTNQVNGFLAVFNRTPRILRTTLTAANTISIQATSGDRTDVVLQATPDIESPNWVNITTNDVPGFLWTTEIPVGANPQRFFRAVSR